jgi:hypothetical protein
MTDIDDRMSTRATNLGARRRAQGLLRRFRKDNRAVAATEFALLLPVMLTMYIGTVEITEAYYVDRRVTLLTRVAGDLIARPEINNWPMNNFRRQVSTSVSTLLPAKVAGTKVRVTAFGVDGGGPANAPRAFVDWQLTCTVTGIDNAGAPALTCNIGSDAAFGPDQKRCDIDAAVSTDVMKRGTPLIRVETTYTHIPILASLFSGGGGASWFSFIAPTGFKLDRSYFTWPRENKRSEGPTSPAMPVKANASSNQDLDPSDSTVCGASGIPLLERFVP